MYHHHRIRSTYTPFWALEKCCMHYARTLVLCITYSVHTSAILWRTLISEYVKSSFSELARALRNVCRVTLPLRDWTSCACLFVCSRVSCIFKTTQVSSLSKAEYSHARSRWQIARSYVSIFGAAFTILCYAFVLHCSQRPIQPRSHWIWRMLWRSPKAVRCFYTC